MNKPRSPLINVIASARPNFVKIAPILRAIQQRQTEGSPLRCRRGHEGQPYGARLSGDWLMPGRSIGSSPPGFSPPTMPAPTAVLGNSWCTAGQPLQDDSAPAFQRG